MNATRAALLAIGLIAAAPTWAANDAERQKSELELALGDLESLARAGPPSLWSWPGDARDLAHSEVLRRSLADALAERIRILSDQLRSPPAPRAPALPRLIAPVDGLPTPTPDGAAIAFAAAPDATVRNPAPGVVAYAGDIAGLGGVVILKGADDLHLVLSGLGAVAVRRGETLAQGAMLGSMSAEGPARLRLEARLGARPIDARPLFRPSLRLVRPRKLASGRARQGMLRGAP